MQLINIKRIKGDHISVNELDIVHTIALGTEPASGYARSLYRLLTGIRLPIEFIDLDGKNSPRTMMDTKENNIYPNPVSGKIKIEWATIIKQLTIVDITGKVIKKIPIDNDNTDIDLTELNNGIYIFHILDENDEMSTEKIIKI